MNDSKRQIVSIEWVPVSEECPDYDYEDVLVTLESGLIFCAMYYANEDGDYWKCLEEDYEDAFFVTDPVVAWAEFPKGYVTEM